MVIPGGVAGRRGSVVDPSAEFNPDFERQVHMSDTLNLPAETRERAGKGASRALRRDGRVPAVVYGGKEEPLAIHVEEKELTRQLMTGHFFNSIVEVEVGGKQL